MTHCHWRTVPRKSGSLSLNYDFGHGMNALAAYAYLINIIIDSYHTQICIILDDNKYLNIKTDIEA